MIDPNIKSEGRVQVLSHKNLMDWIFILIWPLIATAITWFAQLDFVPAMLIFLVIPSLYLRARLGKSPNSLRFGLYMGVPLAIIIDYLMEISNAWVLGTSFFGETRLFGYVFIEQIPWLFIFAYLVVMFYRRFVPALSEEENQRLKKMKLSWLAGWHGFLFLSFVSAWFWAPELLIWRYAYLKVGLLIGVTPALYALGRYPFLFKRFLTPTVYFFYFSLIYELISLKMGHWAFPNQAEFLAYVELFGHSFPYEELIFWILLGPLCCLSYFELFGGEQVQRL